MWLAPGWIHCTCGLLCQTEPIKLMFLVLKAL